MIAHVDADSFFASVLVRKDPRLRGKPLLALGMGGGCVIAASYEAKALGVKTGMPLAEALTFAPHAVQRSSDFNEAGLASQQIESILQTHCPLVEQMSVDEWYLDLATRVGGVPKNPSEVARSMQKDVLDQTGLSVSVGVGPSKLLAKMSGEYRKPSGICVTGTGTPDALDIETFLRDRPAAAIPGIGRRRSIHCEAEGWHTAWDIARAENHRLTKHFGRPGTDLKRELLGECLSAVSVEYAPPKSVSRARSFKPSDDTERVWAHLLRHTEYTVLKMRRDALGCKGLSVWLRDGEYEYESSHVSLPKLMDTEENLRPYVRRALAKIIRKRRRYTQVGLALWRLEPMTAAQFSLFEDPHRLIEAESVQKTLDSIHERFGRNAITHGSALPVKTGTKRSFEVPIYEEGPR